MLVADAHVFRDVPALPTLGVQVANLGRFGGEVVELGLLSSRQRLHLGLGVLGILRGLGGGLCTHSSLLHGCVVLHCTPLLYSGGLYGRKCQNHVDYCFLLVRQVLGVKE